MKRIEIIDIIPKPIMITYCFLLINRQKLYDHLGEEFFFQLFDVLLVDNGAKFSNPSAIEKIGISHHIHVFYAEPNRSDEKESCEVNHENFRRIVSKGYSMNLFTQEDINLIFTQTNNIHRRSLGGNTAYATFIQSFKEAKKALTEFFHIQQEERIILKPALLRKGILIPTKKKEEE